MSKFASGGVVEPTMKLYMSSALIIFLLFSGASVFAQDAELPADFSQLFKSSVVFGEITKDTPAYNDWGTGRRQIGQFLQGETVEIVRDRSFQWYLVRAENGREGWVPVDSLAIPKDPETNREQLPREILEAYVNTRGLTSKTDQLVWVDIDRQLTHVFIGSQGSWQLVRTMPCSTGRNVSPTLRGVHEIAERGEWFFTERFGRGGENWVQFAGPYMFHSLPMDRQGNILDYTLRERLSSGCIRLSMEDSEWFYTTIKRKTAVFVD